MFNMKKLDMGKDVSRMFIVGLTGASGSGKSKFVRVAEKNGVSVIDTDKIARDVVGVGSPCLAALTLAFSDEILSNDGTLDRKKLAKLAFSSKKNTDKLNRIVHPYVIAQTKKKILSFAAAGKKIVLMDVPLLFESGMNEMCDKTIAVMSNEKVRLERIILRDGLTETQANARIGAGQNDSFYTAKVDLLIENIGTVEQYEKNMENAVEIIFSWMGRENDE